MFDKLIDWLLGVWNEVLPFTTIPYYDKGVRLRFGIPKDTLEPGFHWKIPFVDNIVTQMVKTKTINLLQQNITTRDGIAVLTKAVIKYEVEDVRKVLLEVNDPVDALADMVQGIVRDKIVGKDWIECNDPKLVSEISRAAKAEAKKWGLTILEITLTDLVKVQYIRLLDSSISCNPQ